MNVVERGDRVLELLNVAEHVNRLVSKLVNAVHVVVHMRAFNILVSLLQTLIIIRYNKPTYL